MGRIRHQTRYYKGGYFGIRRFHQEHGIIRVLQLYLLYDYIKVGRYTFRAAPHPYFVFFLFMIRYKLKCLGILSLLVNPHKLEARLRRP